MELGVLFALSVSLLIWGILRHLNNRVILVGSLFSLMLPSLLIPLFSPQNTPTLFQQLLFVPFRGNGIFLLYPILPWFGLCVLGLYLGENILIHSKKLLKIGFLLSAVFFIIRLSGFGSLYSASKLSDGVIPFLSMVKYPADLSFITLTLSILFILMTLLLLCPSYVKKRLHFLKVFGKEPLFFYFAHLILYASLSPYFPNGASVQMLYLIWLISLPVLFLLCFGWHKLKIILSEKWDS